MAEFTPDEYGKLMDYLMRGGTRDGLILADMVNQKFGASARRREDALFQADRKISDAAITALVSIDSILDEWEEKVGENSEAHRVFGPQVISIEHILKTLKPVIDEARPENL